MSLQQTFSACMLCFFTTPDIVILSNEFAIRFFIGYVV